MTRANGIATITERRTWRVLGSVRSAGSVVERHNRGRCREY